MKDKKQGKQEKEWHFGCKLPYVYPNISVTKMAMQGQLLLTSAKGGHQTLPNGGTVYNNTGSSGGSPRPSTIARLWSFTNGINQQKNVFIRKPKKT